MPDSLATYLHPTINGVLAQNLVAPFALENIVQSVIEVNGQGVVESVSALARGASKITIVRPLPNTQKSRRLGATANGSAFPTTTGSPQTAYYDIDIITVLDEPLDIRQQTIDMIDVDVLKMNIVQLSDNYALNLNAMTIAGKVAASLLEAQVVEVTLTGDGVRTALLTGSSMLDDGDTENGVHIFPENDRAIVIRPSFRVNLLSSAGTIIGGSNYAQGMLVSGAIDPESRKEHRRGFIGYFDNAPVYMASSAIWDLAEEYLGIPDGSLDDVYGYISSGIGNLRGVAMEHNVNIIPHPVAQGVRLQPDCRMGFKTIYPKSNVFFTKTSFVAPDGYSITLQNFAPGSRVAPTLTLVAADGVDTAAGVTPTTVLATGRTAATKKYFFSTSGTVALTLLAFEAGYAAAAAGDKGAFTTSKVSPSVDGTYYGYFQVIDDLGNIVIEKSDAVVRS